MDPAIIQEMSSRLVHRGSDNTGLLIRGPVALGHRLLHTTPESLNEVQPLGAHEVPVLLCCDARIDNRGELLALTALRGRNPREVTDSELILASFVRWGADCPQHLLGDFAFAVWDGRDESLHLVRDHMGVRSLYYHCGSRTVAFATEIKALFAEPDVPRRLDEMRVAEYLELELDDTERTFYKEVSRVPAAHSIRIERDGIRKTRYWRLDATLETRLSSDDEYAEAVLEMFKRSVEYRVRSAFPVAATLSGGLDSSGIACVARDLLSRSHRPRLHTLSAIFPGLPDDERKVADESEFIRAVVDTGGFESHLVPVDHLSPLHELDRVLYHVDEPVLAYNLYMHWALYGTARSVGARVFLDGFDGDACIGYGRELISDLARAGNWTRFEKEIRALAQVLSASSASADEIAKRYAVPILEEHARSGRWGESLRGAVELSRRFGLSRASLSLNHGLRPVLGKLRRAIGMARKPETQQPRLTNREFAQRIGFRLSQKNSFDNELKTAAESHRESLEMPGFQLTLEIADKTSAAFGLEARYPFFDRDLMQLCVSLPVDQKLSNGWPRAVFRRAMQGILPPLVQWRAEKQDLSPAFIRGLRRDEVMTGSLAALHVDSVVSPYVNLQEVARRQRRFSAEIGGRSSSADASALYRVRMLLAGLSVIDIV